MRRVVLLLLLAIPGGVRAESGEAGNLVANGDFSQVANGQPQKWALSGSAENVSQTLSVVQEADGPSFARLICTRCESPGGANHAMLAQNGVVQLAKGRLYQFSCRLRATQLASRTISVGIQETKGWLDCGLSGQFTVGPAWKEYKTTFRAARDVGPTGRLQIWFTEPGTLDVADVSIIATALQKIEFTDVLPPAGGKNLVRNGSFELGGAGWSSLGTGAGWGNLDRLHGTIENRGGTHGASFLRIPLGGDRTPVLYFDYFEPVVKHELRPLAASLGWIRVESGAAYTLSCDMRASIAGTRAALAARTSDPTTGRSRDYSQRLELAESWKRYSLTFRPQSEWAFVLAGPDAMIPLEVHVDIDAIQLEKSESATPFQPRTDVEFAVEPCAAAGIFTEGEPAALLVRLANRGGTPATANVEFSVSDYADKPAVLRPLSIDVPANSTAQHDLTLPAHWKGYYRIQAKAWVRDKIETSDLRIAVVPRRENDDSVCGINHAFVSAEQIRLAGKAGVTWYRDWSLKWQHIEPEQGQYRWDVSDTQIDRVLREGCRVLPLLPPFPSAEWNTEAPASLAAGKGYPANRMRCAFAPKDPQQLGEFVGKAVGRYKDRIHIWEFLNEPIYTSYALPADRAGKFGGRRYTPADYVALLEVAARGMRSADPTAKVMGGIAGWPKTLTREVIEAGCLKHVDIFNLHMYPANRAPETFAAEMKDLRSLMNAHGGRKPIWITEFSYYGADNLPRRPFFPSENDWAEARLLDSERQCADFTLRYFLVMLSHGVEKIFIHSGASGRVNDPNYECALFDNGSAPRKLFPALAVLTGLLGERPTFAADRTLGDLGHATAFETGTHSLVALWSEADESNQRIAVPTMGGLRVLDVMGRPILGNNLQLSGSPAYLVGPPDKARELLEAVGLGA